MRIRKSHPLIRQTIHVRSENFGIAIVTLQVAIPHVIHQDEHDIRLLPGSRCMERRHHRYQQKHQ